MGIKLSKANQFFVEHNSDLILMKKLIDDASKELPAEVASILNECIRDAIRNGDFQSGIEAHELCQQECSWWGKDFYSSGKNSGIFFGIDGIANALVSHNTGTDPFAFIYANGTKIPIAKVKDGLTKAKPKLIELGVHLGSGQTEDPGYLCIMPVGDILNITSLRNPENAINELVQKLIAFTNLIAPILKRAIP